MALATDKVTYKFKLYDTASQPVNGIEASLQFFQASTRTWEEVYTGPITDGVFTFSESLNKTAYSVFLRESIVPEVRIVTVNPYYKLQKPEVLAFTCEFSSVPSGQTTNFFFDFGTAFLIDRDTALTADVFVNFIVITSPFSLVNTLQADLASCQAASKRLSAENASLKSDLSSCQESSKKLLAENASLTQKVTALSAEIQAKDEKITTLNTMLTEAQLQAEQQALQITQLNSTNQEQASTIASLQLQIEELQTQVSRENPIPVKTLYENLVREIDASTQNSSDSGYKLANISLKLKTLVTSDANGINAQLLGLNEMELVNGAAVSELVFDIAPSVTPASQTGKMPNLLGLTETAVRRITDSVGLRLNPVYQSNLAIVNGDSFRQSPAEGALYKTNDFVTVIFSKHE